MPSPAPNKFNLIKRLIDDLRLLTLLIRDYLKGRYRDVSPMGRRCFHPLPDIPDHPYRFDQRFHSHPWTNG